MSNNNNNKNKPANKKPQKSSDSEKECFWLIMGEEETPLGIALAKTNGGAKRIYAKRTGRDRDSIYVERLKFKNQFVGFSPST